MSILASKIDQLGKLAEEIAPIKPKLKQYEDLRKEIVAAFDGEPGDRSFVECGKLYEVEISERAEERVVNMARLEKHLGRKRFMAVVGLSMKALDQNVAPEDQKAMVTTELTGSRRVTPRRKQPKEAA